MPRHRSPRERLATGIYRDATGVSIIVSAGGQSIERRHPRDLSLTRLLALRDALETQERKRHRRRTPATGTLAAAVAQYLPTLTAMPSFKSRRRQLALWVEALGTRKVSTLTSVDIAAQLATWASTPRSDEDGAVPYSAQYVVHLRTALGQLWATLYPEADNPVTRVPRMALPEAQARAVPPLALARILHAMAVRSVYRARLALMATTGLGPVDVMRVRPQDIDLEAGVLVARARRKGKGTAARAIPLTRHARLAARTFVARDAFGSFSTSNLRRAFRVAAAAAGYVLKDADHPDGLDWRPYDARHTFGSAVGAAGGDERAVQQLLGHADIRTTRRYTEGSVDPRVAAAIASLDARRGPRGRGPR